MAARRGLTLIIAGTAAVALAYAAAFFPAAALRWAPWAMTVGIGFLCAGFMVLGAARPGRSLGPIWIPVAFTFVVLVVGLGLALALPGTEGPRTRLLAGLPPRAALVLYGVGLLPALVLPLGYALTFKRFTLDAADIERIRSAREQRDGSLP